MNPVDQKLLEKKSMLIAYQDGMYEVAKKKLRGPLTDDQVERYARTLVSSQTKSLMLRQIALMFELEESLSVLEQLKGFVMDYERLKAYEVRLRDVGDVE